MRRHGFVSTYNAGCRCEDCRAAAASYARIYRRPRAHGTPSGLPEEYDPMWWADRSACRDYPKDVFFPSTTGPKAYDQARAVCAACPVRQDCLEYALRTRQTDGCWGGLTPQERYLAATA